MRRAQVDRGSQPVRNLFPYGNCEYLTGQIQIVRTNLATDPRATSNTVNTGSAGWRANRWFGQPPGGGNYSLVTGAVDGPIPEITTYTRKTWTVANTLNNGDTGFENCSGASTNPGAGLPITALTTYTFSSYIRTSASGKAGALIQIYWKDASTNWISSSSVTAVALTAGVWTRLSLTATAPAGAVSVGMVTDVDSGTFWAPGDTLDGTGLLIEASTVLLPYFDGNTPASGDFTYGWSGTANNSNSNQIGQVVGGWSSTSGPTNRWACISSTEWSANGSRSVRIIPLSANDGAVDATYSEFTANGLIIGNRYRASVTMRLSAALAGTLSGLTRSFVFPGTPPTNVVQPAVAANATGVWQHWVEFTAANTFHGIRIYNGARIGNGDMWVDAFMLTEAGYSGDFIDGSKPFSKWDGSANASTSVGYPQQLLDFAGKPAIDLTSGQNTGGLPITVDGFIARTFYAVYESTDYNAASWVTPFSYGISGSNGFTYQANAAGQTSMVPRVDFPSGGDTNKTLQLSNSRTNRVHVAAINFPQGLTSIFHHMNGAYAGTMSFNPGPVGWVDGRVSLPNQTGLRSLRGLVYYADHDSATRVAISRYLGNKYGANVA